MKFVRLLKGLLRRRLLVVSILVVCLVVAYRAYQRRGLDVVEDQIVVVQTAPLPEGDYLLYEDIRVRIYIDYDDFEDYLAERVAQEEIPGIRETVARRMDAWQQEVDAKVQERGRYYLNYSEHKIFIAAMLESGRAFISDKQEGLLVDNILVHRYGYFCGALCGRGYRSFYFPSTFIYKENDRPLFPFWGSKFFEVEDWIS